MLAAGILLIWAGYAVGSWGYVLIQGWDIPFRSWVSPFNPYQFAPGTPPPTIPPSQVLPGRAAGQQYGNIPPGAGPVAPPSGGHKVGTIYGHQNVTSGPDLLPPPVNLG